MDINKILSLEFNHASKMAFQADEDKVRVFSYFLAATGTLIASLFFDDLEDKRHLFVFGALFAGLAVIGVMSLLKLAKLRLSWIDSVRTMHRIKNFYIQERSDLRLKEAFRWTDKTIPSPGKKWTVAFLMAVTISFLNGFSAGAAVFFWGLALAGKIMAAPILLSGLLVFLLQMFVWMRVCRDKK